MQVTRRRRRVEKGRRVFLVTAGATSLVVVAGGGAAVASTYQFGADQVGQTTRRGQVVSADQYIDPIGKRLVINNGKIMSSAVSPDGTHVAAAVADGGEALAIVDLKSWKVQQLIGNNAAADLRISGNDVGQEGPTYSPDGSHLWLSQADGFRTFTVNPDGSLANPTFVAIPADGPKRALVSQAVFAPDGSTVYSA